METQCQKRYPTTFRPELHQSPVPLGFCYAKHGNRATRGQHCTLSVRNSALHPTSLEHRACHDANIAPWLLLANRLGLQASRQDLKSTNFYLSSDCAVPNRFAGQRSRVERIIPPVMSWLSGKTLWTQGQGLFPLLFLKHQIPNYQDYIDGACQQCNRPTAYTGP